MDLFKKIASKKSPLGQFANEAHHYYTFPKLEGELAPRMGFRGKTVLNWSLNNYLGLGNHSEVRKADADAAAEYGCAYPMGAFIRIKAVIQSRREYFDVGVAGPIAGFVMALLVLWYGFSHLPPAEYIFEIHPEYQVHGLDYADHVYEGEGMAFQLGENLIFWFFKTYVADPDLLPHPNEMIHYPFILAGYLALFFTALNLLPIGQLDGGHVIFGLFGSKIAQRINQVFYTLFLFYAGLGWISPDLLAGVSLESVFSFVAYVGIYLYFVYLAVASMIPETRDRWFFAVVLLALQYAVTSFTAIVGYDGWLLFVFLIGRFLGVYHPKAVDDTPLDEKRNIIGWVAILIFLLCFSPQPFSLG